MESNSRFTDRQLTDMQNRLERVEAFLDRVFRNYDVEVGDIAEQQAIDELVGRRRLSGGDGQRPGRRGRGD